MFNALSKYEAFAFNALKEKYEYRFKSVMWFLSTLFNMLVQYFLWTEKYIHYILFSPFNYYTSVSACFVPGTSQLAWSV